MRQRTERSRRNGDNRITLKTSAAHCIDIERNSVKKYIWGGIIIWGTLVICFGLGTMNPTYAVANSAAGALPDQEVIFLLSGGIVACLLGTIGLLRFHGEVSTV